MHTELPSRAYVELPPPPDGFATVRREASRRRARRTVAAVAGGASAAEIEAVAILLRQSPSRSVHAVTVERYGAAATAPPGAIVLYHGEDSRNGPMLVYAQVISDAAA